MSARTHLPSTQSQPSHPSVLQLRRDGVVDEEKERLSGEKQRERDGFSQQQQQQPVRAQEPSGFVPEFLNCWIIFKHIQHWLYIGGSAINELDWSAQSWLRNKQTLLMSIQGLQARAVKRCGLFRPLSISCEHLFIKFILQCIYSTFNVFLWVDSINVNFAYEMSTTCF